MANGVTYLLDSDAETGREGSISGYNQGFFMTGQSGSGTLKGALRFSNVVLPQGSSVNAANLFLYTKFQGSGSGNLKFKTYGIKENDTGNFSSSPFGRTKTTASDTADNPLPGVGNYKSVSVTSMVNEIIQQGGWASGNHMGFFCEDNGSNSDVYIEDDDGASLLIITITANPDFTPGPYTSRIPGPPPARDFGIRVSRENFDAFTTNIQKLNFFSRLNVLKAIRDAEKGWTPSSNEEKVDHGLKYPPAFLSYYKTGNKVYIANSNSAISGVATVFPYTDAETIHMVLDPNASDPQSWYYYVFIDENLI